jgi:ribosomal protein S18 acetylase RimI-like enzyme
MLQQTQGLNDTALEAIAGLERRVVAADGGRLKLEWGTLRNRPTDEVRDLLWWEDGRLLGFLGIYGYRTAWFEVTGMVDPDARRGGIARALFSAALPIVCARGAEHVLMVVPRAASAGGEFARALGMSYEHSEHALTLGARPDEWHGSDLQLREATTDDIPKLSELYLEAFGNGDVDPARLAGERSLTLMIDRDGESVGTVAVARDGERSAIYGFVVSAQLRGRGIGREVLRRVCRDRFDSGASRVDLEVEVENDRALGLYTSVGFEPVATDDYYELLV